MTAERNAPEASYLRNFPRYVCLMCIHLRKWHRPPTSHSEETPGRQPGEAVKQRAPEPPVFTHLSLARASMKMWCILKGDTAIKWRELLVVEEPSPVACVAHNIFGETPAAVFLDMRLRGDLQFILFILDEVQ